MSLAFCVICDRRISDEDYVCSDACQREADRRSEAAEAWVPLVDALSRAALAPAPGSRRELLRTRFGVPVFDDVRTVHGPFAADAERDAVREQSVAVGGRGGPPVAGRAREAAADADEQCHALGSWLDDGESPVVGAGPQSSLGDVHGGLA